MLDNTGARVAPHDAARTHAHSSRASRRVVIVDDERARGPLWRRAHAVSEAFHPVERKVQHCAADASSVESKNRHLNLDKS